MKEKEANKQPRYKEKRENQAVEGEGKFSSNESL